MGRTALALVAGTAALVLAVLFPVEGRGEDSRTWWADAQRLARDNGYRLVDHEGLESMLEGSESLILDVRPDYEFDIGHIPQSRTLEFDLGDLQGISPEKTDYVRAVLGSDKKRPIVIYCRSFR
ncbi:MAG: rhodanese-like domain-containing protein [Desulfovibrionales bacterium]